MPAPGPCCGWSQPKTQLPGACSEPGGPSLRHPHLLHPHPGMPSAFWHLPPTEAAGRGSGPGHLPPSPQDPAAEGLCWGSGVQPTARHPAQRTHGHRSVPTPPKSEPQPRCLQATGTRARVSSPSLGCQAGRGWGQVLGRLPSQPSDTAPAMGTQATLIPVARLWSTSAARSALGHTGTPRAHAGLA